MDEDVYGADAWRTIQNSFQHVKGIYLDHAASTLYSQTIVENSLAELLKHNFGNPHSRNAPSRLTTDLIDQTRAEILDFFHADPNEYSLIFTSGATDSFRLVAESFQFQNVTKQEPSADNINNSSSFIYLRESHTSVIGMREYFKQQVPCYSLPSDDIIEYAYKNKDQVLLSDDGAETTSETTPNNSLFVFPAQCNFSGFKYPLELIKISQQGAFSSIESKYCINKEFARDKKEGVSTTWYCLLDAASYAGTNPLNLSIWKPDMVAISFYKIFGFPTGVGGLIVHKRAHEVLRKKYFGGGTVEFVLSSQDYHMARRSLQEKFENGTLNFLSILSLRFGLRELRRMVTSMEKVSIHTFRIAQLVYTSLSNLKYPNGQNLVQIYSHADFSDRQRQGGIVAFNLLTERGSYIGYAQVEKILALHDIYVRTGCFCNPGACQRFLHLTDEDVRLNFMSGHKCGDENDLIDGRPTGAVRVSFGYMSSEADVINFIKVIRESFLEEKNEPDDKKLEYNLQSASAVELIGMHIYPIKSCGAFSPKSWPITSTGLLYDRYWIIVNEAGAALTQKREPKLCKIKPEIDLANKKLILRWHDSESTISMNIDGQLSDEREQEHKLAKIGGKITKFVECQAQVNLWLSGVLDQPGLKLLRCVDVQSSVMNDSSFLLLNRNSVISLKNGFSNPLAESLTTENCLTRFRGNFVVDGIEAFKEDECSQVEIGNVLFKNVGPCYRCQMVCVDQNTAVRNQEALCALTDRRGKKMPFGIRLELDSIVANESIIHVNSPVILDNLGDVDKSS